MVERGVTLLLADDDAAMRALVSAAAREATDGLAVLEAEDGAEAIQLGLQQQPQLALLDVNMPRLGGIEAAAVLVELLPQLRLALYSGETEAHREHVRSLGLPLFGKADLDRVIEWVSARPRPTSPAFPSPGRGRRAGARRRVPRRSPAP